MQDTLFEPTSLPELPTLANPSMLEHLLFESSIVTAGVLAVAAVLIAFLLVRASKAKRGMLVLTLGLAGAVGVFALSALVETPREQLYARATALVDAVSIGDEPAMRSLLDPGVRVRTRFGGAGSSDQVIQLVTSRANAQIDEVHADEIRVGLAGPRVARTQILVRGQAQGRLPKSWWVIDWARPDTDSDQWVATHIEPIWIQGMSDPAGP
ncbi:MAG: hypothetical protein KC996_05105 [Phycisphaerales bacterium]|nr:hypothetical protein [Phycisphaerales bacterium]